MIHIYIPTRGRKTSSTFEALPHKYVKHTRFVCSTEDKAILSKKYPQAMFVLQPDHIDGIADKRQFIVDYAYKIGQKKIVMMDDDLFFAVREENTLKLAPSKITDVNDMLMDINDQLDNFSHGGVSAREGNNRFLDDMATGGRYMRILAYNVDAIVSAEAKFDRVRVMEDFDMSLQLLRAGHQNFVLWRYTHDQKKSGAAGGCSSWRNNKVQDFAARKLARLHKGFVKVVQKETKGAWGNMGNTRTDVRVSWKKAWESSQ